MINEKEKEIIDTLKKTLGYDAPKIKQEQFDNIVDYIMNNETKGGNPKELIWRLSGCYYSYLNLNKVIDIFVDTKDAYYTSELVSFVGGNIDQDYLITKMLDTNDIKFISDSLANCGHAMENFLDKEHLNTLKNFIVNKKES